MSDTRRSLASWGFMAAERPDAPGAACDASLLTYISGGSSEAMRLIVQDLADVIGVKVQFVHQMAREERPVPATRCVTIALASGGAVTPHDFRPDVFPEEKSPAWLAAHKRN